MNPTGIADVAELMAQIAALQAANRQLAERVVKLEEELALARLHRFAPRSEKHVDRIFNEAEQSTVDGNDEDRDLDDEADSVDLPDTGLPQAEQPERRKSAASHCLRTCRASASTMILPTIRKPARAVAIRCIAWASW